MADNIPPHAVKVTFDYSGVRGQFHVWTDGRDVRWSALGNSGEEATYEDAITSARHWVKGVLVKKTDKEIL